MIKENNSNKNIVRKKTKKEQIEPTKLASILLDKIYIPTNPNKQKKGNSKKKAIKFFSQKNSPYKNSKKNKKKKEIDKNDENLKKIQIIMSYKSIKKTSQNYLNIWTSKQELYSSQNNTTIRKNHIKNINNISENNTVINNNRIIANSKTFVNNNNSSQHRAKISIKKKPGLENIKHKYFKNDYFNKMNYCIRGIQALIKNNSQKCSCNNSKKKKKLRANYFATDKNIISKNKLSKSPFDRNSNIYPKKNKKPKTTKNSRKNSTIDIISSKNSSNKYLKTNEKNDFCAFNNMNILNINKNISNCKIQNVNSIVTKLKV